MFYYSIYDKKTRSFGMLSAFEHNEPEAAMRWMSDYLNSNEKSMYYRHAEDFDLYLVGEWIEEEGVFNTDKQHVCCIADLIISEPQTKE